MPVLACQSPLDSHCARVSQTVLPPVTANEEAALSRIVAYVSASELPPPTCTAAEGRSGGNSRRTGWTVTGAAALRITVSGSSPLALEISDDVSRMAPGVGADRGARRPARISSPARCQARRYAYGSTTPS